MPEGHLASVTTTSASRPKADIGQQLLEVRYVPIVLQKSLAGSVKNSEGRWRVLRVMIRGTSSPCAKFMGDFGSATDAVRIIDLFALLQHNLPEGDIADAPHVADDFFCLAVKLRVEAVPIWCPSGCFKSAALGVTTKKKALLA